MKGVPRKFCSLEAREDLSKTRSSYWSSYWKNRFLSRFRWWAKKSEKQTNKQTNKNRTLYNFFCTVLICHLHRRSCTSDKSAVLSCSSSTKNWSYSVFITLPVNRSLVWSTQNVTKSEVVSQQSNFTVPNFKRPSSSNRSSWQINYARRNKGTVSLFKLLRSRVRSFRHVLFIWKQREALSIVLRINKERKLRGYARKKNRSTELSEIVLSVVPYVMKTGSHILDFEILGSTYWIFLFFFFLKQIIICFIIFRDSFWSQTFMKWCKLWTRAH